MIRTANLSDVLDGLSQKWKVNRFREKSKITKKLSKITIFWKILTSVTSDLSAGYNSPTCAWWDRALKKLKNFQKIASGDDFSQKVGFWPPQPAKSAIHEVSTKMGPYTKSFFHRFQTTCKVSSTSDGSFPRSQNFLHPGSLVKGILSGRAPTPPIWGKLVI